MAGRSKESRVGETYGRLTITGICEKKDYVHCVCTCGEKVNAQVSKLTNGYTRSCGCLRREIAAKRTMSHGMTGSATFQSWKGMLSRCQNENTPGYEHYGGRGIYVCERWLKFENFFQDMGERPEGTSLDRVNNDLGYMPENCRWADNKTQVRNRRCTVVADFDGQSKPLAEWSEILGISYHTLHNNLRRGGSIASLLQKTR